MFQASASPQVESSLAPSSVDTGRQKWSGIPLDRHGWSALVRHQVTPSSLPFLIRRRLFRRWTSRRVRLELSVQYPPCCQTLHSSPLLRLEGSLQLSPATVNNIARSGLGFIQTSRMGSSFHVILLLEGRRGMATEWFDVLGTSMVLTLYSCF